MQKYQKIGIDLDGVLIDHRDHKRELAKQRGISLEWWQTNTNVMGRFIPEALYRDLRNELYGALTLSAPPVEGALAHLAAIKSDIFLVSARSADAIRFAQEWLLRHHIYDLIRAERIFFCQTGDDKRGHCERLGLDFFLDDRKKVLDALPLSMTRALFDTDGIADMLEVGPDIKVAANWREAFTLINTPISAL